jgi:hypothetical protein
MFSRAIVARTDEVEATGLVERIKASLELVLARLRASTSHSDSDTEHAIRQMIATTQILSRFCLRVPSKAGAIFSLAAKCCRDDGLRVRVWVSRAFMGLADRAVESMTEVERNERAVELLMLPLPGEQDETYYYSTGGKDPCHWLGSHSSPPTRSTDPTGWKQAIDILIGAVGTRGMGRIVAIQRLQLLEQLHVLTPEEQARLAGVMWAAIPHEFQRPETFGLPSSVFLRLPELHSGQAVALFRSAMLTQKGPLYVGLTDDRFFAALYSSVRCAPGETRGPIELTTSECSLVLDRVERWLLSPRTSRRGVIAPDHADAGTAVINSFSYAILPSLEPGSAASVQALAAIDRMTSVGCQTQVLSHWVAHLSPAVLPQVIERLRLSASSAQGETASLAMIAIRLWVTVASSGKVATPPASLAELAPIAVASERPDCLAAALDTAAVLVTYDITPGGVRFHPLLLEALSSLLNKATYNGTMERENERMSIGDIRTGCVRLACALAKRGVTGTPVADWLAAASIDSLPEVRKAGQG